MAGTPPHLVPISRDRPGYDRHLLSHHQLRATPVPRPPKLRSAGIRVRAGRDDWTITGILLIQLPARSRPLSHPRLSPGTFVLVHRTQCFTDRFPSLTTSTCPVTSIMNASPELSPSSTLSLSPQSSTTTLSPALDAPSKHAQGLAARRCSVPPPFQLPITTMPAFARPAGPASLGAALPRRRARKTIIVDSPATFVHVLSPALELPTDAAPEPIQEVLVHASIVNEPSPPPSQARPTTFVGTGRGPPLALRVVIKPTPANEPVIPAKPARTQFPRRKARKVVAVASPRSAALIQELVMPTELVDGPSPPPSQARPTAVVGGRRRPPIQLTLVTNPILPNGPIMPAPPARLRLPRRKTRKTLDADVTQPEQTLEDGISEPVAEFVPAPPARSQLPRRKTRKTLDVSVDQSEPEDAPEVPVLERALNNVAAETTLIPWPVKVVPAALETPTLQVMQAAAGLTRVSEWRPAGFVPTRLPRRRVGKKAAPPPVEVFQLVAIAEPEPAPVPATDVLPEPAVHPAVLALRVRGLPRMKRASRRRFLISESQPSTPLCPTTSAPASPAHSQDVGSCLQRLSDNLYIAFSDGPAPAPALTQLLALTPISAYPPCTTEGLLTFTHVISIASPGRGRRPASEAIESTDKDGTHRLHLASADQTAKHISRVSAFLSAAAISPESRLLISTPGLLPGPGMALAALHLSRAQKASPAEVLRALDEDEEISGFWKHVVDEETIERVTAALDAA
jgi:hypothetical protein